MGTLFRIVCIIGICGFSLPSQASAAANCNSHDKAGAELKKKYGEILADISAMADGKMLEVYRNPATMSWTIVVTNPENNISCVVASGEGWKRLIIHKRGEKDI
jgi:hypothetical protein